MDNFKTVVKVLFIFTQQIKFVYRIIIKVYRIKFVKSREILVKVIIIRIIVRSFSVQ